MCIGVPMCVESISPGRAMAVVDGERRDVSTLLLGEPLAPGDHVLVHADNAVRKLDPEEAALIRDALAAVLAASDGHPFEHLVADLIDREPELPAHLKPGQPT